MWDGLERIGLKCYISEKERRLPSLTAVQVPEGVDPGAVCSHMLEQYNIEIGNGLGELSGKIWRIGLMGYNATRSNVYHLVWALESAIKAVKRV